MELQQRKQDIILTKIDRRKWEIRRYFTSNTAPITDIVYRETKDYERYEDAVKKEDYKPIRVGDHWGGGMNAWFKICFTIPGAWKGKEVAAYFNFGGECCAFIDGKPYQGIDNNHQEVLLTKSAKGGETFEIVVDAASERPWEPTETRKAHFSLAQIATRNPEVQDYWYNLDVLHSLANQLPPDNTRRAKITYVLNKSVDAFDYTNTDEASLKRSASAANRILKPLLDCRAHASATNIAVHGHSHLDVAWVWPYRETVRKCSRTFSTVMRLMEQYPEYIFTQSQAQLYDFTKQNYPALYEEIKKRVKENRWDVCGSMWVEADCNLSSGESLVRQVLVGKNFFKDEFGIETDVLWLPDVFGYSAALPQILQKARVPYFSTIKISWNQFNKFPYNTFHWTGIDGTSVLAHFPPSGDYGAYPDSSKLLQQERQYKEKDRCDWSLLSYGHGDGGGGAETRHLEVLRRSKDLEGLPKCRQTKVSDFFHKIDRTPDLPEWVGELYLELHRGTYTTQARNKWLNRKAEYLYRDIELLSSAVAPLGLPYPKEELAKQWKDLLCQQFHDVIPGSSIRQVYEDTEIIYKDIFEAGNTMLAAANAKLAECIDTTGEGEAILIANTLPWERTELVSVKLPAKGDFKILSPSGAEVPSQTATDTGGHSAKTAESAISFTATVPSMGYSVYRLVKKAPARAKSDIKITKNRLENKFYKIELDNKGVIKSILHKASAREVLPKGERANLFQLFEDKPMDWDAWDIDFFYDDKYEDITDLQSIDVVDEGPLSGSVEMARKFGKSQIKQKIIIYAHSPRIDFDTWVDWHEDHKVLKVSFPVDVNSPKARYEIQFGNAERPTHSNTSWDFAKFEVCAQKWADLSEENFGLSLMNDCKYGHHTKDNVMRLSLLRSAKEPDPQADMREHIFTYSIMPHTGDYVDAGTVRHAYQLNVPMRTLFAKASKGTLPSQHSFFSVDAENVILETVKGAEKEDSTILRFYECHNKRAKVSVKVNVPFKRVHECDLMEDNTASVPSKDGGFTFDIKPFEIKTFKLV